MARPISMCAMQWFTPMKARGTSRGELGVGEGLGVVDVWIEEVVGCEGAGCSSNGRPHINAIVRAARATHCSGAPMPGPFV